MGYISTRTLWDKRDASRPCMYAGAQNGPAIRFSPNRLIPYDKAAFFFCINRASIKDLPWLRQEAELIKPHGNGLVAVAIGGRPVPSRSYLALTVATWFTGNEFKLPRETSRCMRSYDINVLIMWRYSRYDYMETNDVDICRVRYNMVAFCICSAFVFHGARSCL